MSYTEKVIAMASMFQAGSLVRDVARTGQCDATRFETAIKSIINSNAESTEDVYGGIANLETGLRMMSTMFNRENKERDMEISRYVLGIIVLEKQLTKNKTLFAKLGAGIERAEAQTESFSITHENIVANLADTYAETISTLKPRIIVSGEQMHLTNPANANKIRALLFAIMRSAVLWKQKGGTRMMFLFGRAKIQKEALRLLNQI